jgi:hypothetical protein
MERRIGFVEPWVGYVAVDDGEGVGGGAFVGAPHDKDAGPVWEWRA